MRISEAPEKLEDLDLMKRLKAYSEGKATWLTGKNNKLSKDTKTACSELYTHLTSLINKAIIPLLSKINTKEMENYTLHDSGHSKKVAHLMWNILDTKTRTRLTPPEIGLMIASAYFHDIGMLITYQEREALLEPNSDLWQMLELDSQIKSNIQKFRKDIKDRKSAKQKRDKALNNMMKAEGALLSDYVRERHASEDKYKHIIDMLLRMHEKDKTKIPDIHTCFSFDGDSFIEKLIDICISHNQDVSSLIELDPHNSARPRFPREYPVGMYNANLKLVAAALRLADILDFDRERTPQVIFLYLLPSSLTVDSHDEEEAILHWRKHLSISNWEVGKDKITFKGHCKSNVVHHAIEETTKDIRREIIATRDVFINQSEDWLFQLPLEVEADIHEIGYRNMHCKFKLDENNIYNMLMGDKLYDHALVAVRELIQNAVDACKLHDAMTSLHNPKCTLSNEDRIFIRYYEQSEVNSFPRLEVEDTGTGMDRDSIEKYFLNVGRSYYNSREFNQIRLNLRKSPNKIDFAPVSEFGIGFLSYFMLGDRVVVETAMTDYPKHSEYKYRLRIDGPSRLINFEECRNDRISGAKGTKITIFLSRGSNKEKSKPPSYKEIRDYIRFICHSLPYNINLEYNINDKCEANKEIIRPLPVKIEIPKQMADITVRIPVNDEKYNIKGEIALFNINKLTNILALAIHNNPIKIGGTDKENENLWIDLMEQGGRGFNYYHDKHSHLIRGGFRISDICGLPKAKEYSFRRNAAVSVLSLNWETNENNRFDSVTLKRDSLTNKMSIANCVTKSWITYLIDRRKELPEDILIGLHLPKKHDSVNETNIELFEDLLWIEKAYDAYSIFEFAKESWRIELTALDEHNNEVLNEWEKRKRNNIQFYLPDRYGDNKFYLELLNAILPKITKLSMELGRCDHTGLKYNVIKPMVNWKKVLQGCHDYLTMPSKWDRFIKYGDELEDSLIISWQKMAHFNISHRNRLETYDDTEQSQLYIVLDELLSNDRFRLDSQTIITKKQANLFYRAQQEIGDLKLGYINSSDKLILKQIKDFRIPKD